MKRKSTLAALLMGAAVCASAAEQETAMQVAFNIQPQPIGKALTDLGEQAGLRVLVRGEDVKPKQRLAQPVNGELTVRAALEKVLADSGLTYEFLDDRTVRVAAAVSPKTQAHRTAEEDQGPLAPAQSRPRETEEAAVAQVNDREESSRARNNNRESMEEVVVTATKREERLIDTPQSVTVVSTEALEKLGAVQLRDFANTIPGLTFTTTGAGFTQIALRGVTTGFLDIGQTVGIYIDEVPYGSSSAFADGPRVTLDAGLFDLDRIEVLRGPQGTLYGASAMGGLLKYATKAPDLHRFGVDVRTGVASTREGSLSYNGSFTVNAPLAEEKAAVRASGFYSHDGGYIDNVSLGDDDVNRSKTYGGRAEVLLRPTDALSVRLNAFLQNISRNGEATADYEFSGVPYYGRLDQGRLTPEPFDQRFRLGSATITYDLGPATLTSISGYQTSATELVQDLSRGYVPLLQSFGLAYSSVGVANTAATDKFTQEIRLTSAGQHVVEWMFGTYYTHESSKFSQNFVLRDPTGQPAPNILLSIFVPSRYEEYAGFGNLTWHLTDAFDVTGGIRYARNDQEVEQVGSGLLIGSRPSSRATENVVTYLANARYRFSDRATSYVRYATGYRPGGPNYAVIDPGTGLPVGSTSFDSDTLKSYEIGFKMQTAEGRFGIDVAAYLIDWDNIQISVIRGGLGAIANSSGSSRVTGSELTLTANPTPGMALSAALSYTDAEMRQADPALGAARGERLPNVPRFSGALNADYRIPFGTLAPTIGATVRYMGPRNAGFDNSVGTAGIAPQYEIPSYATADLRAGITLDRVNLQLFIRNLFDDQGELSAFTWRGSPATAILQPRTVGINASTHF